jgi:hypothetical protein
MNRVLNKLINDSLGLVKVEKKSVLLAKFPKAGIFYDHPYLPETESCFYLEGQLQPL